MRKPATVIAHAALLTSLLSVTPVFCQNSVTLRA
jgi:hypothetical protein